jgi:hypothetical protein
VITAAQLVCHGVGDYLLQSDWMATYKTQRHLPALIHAALYGLPFLLLTHSPLALLVIVGTHFIIDRYRLARHLGWLKNFLAPVGINKPWSECSGTGYPADKPAWLAVWLLIIVDNLTHVLINAAAITFL